MTIGIDAYFDAASVAGLVRGKTTPEKLALWEAYPAPEVILYAVTQQFERLHWIGHKVARDQHMAWPRRTLTDALGTPPSLLIALALEMVERAAGDKAGEGESGLMAQLQDAGVNSYSLDDYAVSFDNSAKSPWLAQGLRSQLAYYLILPYLAEGRLRGEVPIV